MSLLGNILWFICGGLLSGLSWLAFFPFGKEVVYGGGAVSLIANIIWLIVSGIPMAVGNALAGNYMLHYNHRNTVWKAVF